MTTTIITTTTTKYILNAHRIITLVPFVYVYEVKMTLVHSLAKCSSLFAEGQKNQKALLQ